MQEIMNLFNRFVIAVEVMTTCLVKISKTLEFPHTAKADDPRNIVPVTSVYPEAAVEEKEEVVVEVVTEATKYPRNGDRDAWLALCKDRKINVPPRTKTATLIKNVKSWDDARIGEAEFNGNTAAPEKETEKEKAVQQTLSDPFAVVSTEKMEETITMKMVLEALQPIQKEKGNAVVIDILNRVGGVSKLIDLPEDKYAAVYKEAKNG